MQSSLSVVVVGVVDEGGDEGPLEDASAQQQPALDQLLQIFCIFLFFSFELPISVHTFLLMYGSSKSPENLSFNVGHLYV